MKNYFLAVILALVMTTTAYASQPLTVLLDWFINPDHAPLVIAKSNGIFESYDLSVDLVEPADPNIPPKLVAAGQALIAISYQPQLHMQVDQGLPLVRFGTIVATPLNSLVVLRDGPIQSLADLNGRKIGYSIGGFEEAILGTMLKTANVSLSDVELININFSLSPSLISGQVDAVIGAFRNFELNQLDIIGESGKAYYPEEYGVPTYDELIFITRKDRIKDQRLKPFLMAIEQAVQTIQNHPDETWNTFKAYKAGLNDELNIRAWRDTLPRFALRPGAQDSERYNRFANFLVASGLIQSNRGVDAYTIELPAAKSK